MENVVSDMLGVDIWLIIYTWWRVRYKLINITVQLFDIEIACSSPSIGLVFI